MDLKSRTVIACGRGGQSGGIDGTCGHVITDNFHPVDVNDRAIVALEADAQIGDRGGVRDSKGGAEIIGERARSDDGSFAAVTETKLGSASGPRGIIITGRGPVWVRELAVIPVFPDGARRDELSMNRERHEECDGGHKGRQFRALDLHKMGVVNLLSEVESSRAF